MLRWELPSLVVAAGVVWAYACHHRAMLTRFATQAGRNARAGTQWMKQRSISWRVPAIFASAAGLGALMYAIGWIALVILPLMRVDKLRAELVA
jgi:hypothetical protein